MKRIYSGRHINRLVRTFVTQLAKNVSKQNVHCLFNFVYVAIVVVVVVVVVVVLVVVLVVVRPQSQLGIVISRRWSYFLLWFSTKECFPNVLVVIARLLVIGLLSSSSYLGCHH